MQQSGKLQNRCVSRIVAILLAVGLSPAWAQETAVTPAVDHSQMDHSKMDHGSAPAATGASEGMAMDHGNMQGGMAPPDARDPHAYSDGLTFDAHQHMMHSDQQSFAALLVDRLEAVRTPDATHGAYDLQFRYGRDYDRAVLKAEGEFADGRLEDAHTELLWSHAVAAYWDTQLGVRYDSGEEPGRGWLAFGVQGLAPYWFEIEATAYVGDEGRSALRLHAEYELLLTQRLVLQPRVEANLYGKDDAERALGSGLSDAVAGLRLRYEIKREFAPYIGVEYVAKFGNTADYAEAAGEDTGQTRWVAGLRFWY
jgi:copper resistance protein B